MIVLVTNKFFMRSKLKKELLATFDLKKSRKCQDISINPNKTQLVSTVSTKISTWSSLNFKNLDQDKKLSCLVSKNNLNRFQKLISRTRYPNCPDKDFETVEITSRPQA